MRILRRSTGPAGLRDLDCLIELITAPFSKIENAAAPGRNHNSARRCSVISAWMDLIFEFAFGVFSGASVGFHSCKQGMCTYKAAPMRACGESLPACKTNFVDVASRACVRTKPYARAISAPVATALLGESPLIPQTTLKMHFQRMDAAGLLYGDTKAARIVPGGCVFAGCSVFVA